MNKDNKTLENKNAEETQDLSFEQIKEDFDLRERRLKLVYKIIYVLTAVWAALFVSYGASINNATPIYCGLLSALTTSILNILYYIFDELRCMKIYVSAGNEQKVSADNKFLEIWNTFGLSLCLSILIALLNISVPSAINQWVILITSLICIIALGINSWLNSKYVKTKLIIRNIATPILCYAFFAIPLLVEVAPNV